MSEYYQVKEIEGKGTGCVALKEIKPGIMILQEKPQLKLKCGNWSFRDLAIAFKQMVWFTPSRLTKWLWIYKFRNWFRTLTFNHSLPELWSEWLSSLFGHKTNLDLNLKFRFSKKATKFETIYNMIWRLISKCQIKWEVV